MIIIINIIIIIIIILSYHYHISYYMSSLHNLKKFIKETLFQNIEIFKRKEIFQILKTVSQDFVLIWKTR